MGGLGGWVPSGDGWLDVMVGWFRLLRVQVRVWVGLVNGGCLVAAAGLCLLLLANHASFLTVDFSWPEQQNTTHPCHHFLGPKTFKTTPFSQSNTQPHNKKTNHPKPKKQPRRRPKTWICLKKP